MKYHSEYTVYSEKIYPNEQVIHNVHPKYTSASESLEYFNNLPFPVTIVSRDGLRFRLFPRNDRNYPQKLIITKRNMHNVRWAEEFLTGDESDPDYLYILKNYPAEPNIEDAFRPEVTQFVREYCVDAQKLLDYRSINVPNLGIFITMELDDNAYPHPCSAEGLARQSLKKLEPGFNVNIIAVSNSLSTGAFYINLGNKIYQIPCVVSSDKEPGIYFAISHQMSIDGQAVLPPKYQRFKFTDDRDVMPIRLWDSYNDAITKGNSDMFYKDEIAKLKLEIEKEKQEQLRRDSEYKQRELEFKEWERSLKRQDEEYQIKQDRLDAEREDYRRERESQKRFEQERQQHELKMREFNRKDTSEVIKWLPTVIMGIISLATLMYKTSNKN